MNGALADATILQSRYSLEKHLELGFDLRAPVVIPNAVDPAIFHPPERREPLDGQEGPADRVELVGQPAQGRRDAGVARSPPRLGAVRDDLRRAARRCGSSGSVRSGRSPPWRSPSCFATHDVYVAPSRDDPCSNALLEALACGLPAAFLASGGHPELVGEAGLPFEADEELPDVLDRLVEEIEERRAAISIPTIAEVTDRYLATLSGSGLA